MVEPGFKPRSVGHQRQSFSFHMGPCSRLGGYDPLTLQLPSRAPLHSYWSVSGHISTRLSLISLYPLPPGASPHISVTCPSSDSRDSQGGVKGCRTLFAIGGGTCPQNVDCNKAESSGQITGTGADAELPVGSDSAWLPHPLQPAPSPIRCPTGERNGRHLGNLGVQLGVSCKLGIPLKSRFIFQLHVNFSFQTMNIPGHKISVFALILKCLKLLTS